MTCTYLNSNDDITGNKRLSNDSGIPYEEPKPQEDAMEAAENPEEAEDEDFIEMIVISDDSEHLPAITPTKPELYGGFRHHPSTSTATPFIPMDE